MGEFKYRDNDDRAFVKISDNVFLEALRSQGIEVQIDQLKKKLLFACPLCNPRQQVDGGHVQYCLPSKRWLFGRYVCDRCGEKTADQVAQLAKLSKQELTGKSLLIVNRSEIAVQEAVEEALALSEQVYINVNDRQIVLVIVEGELARLERGTVSELKKILSERAWSVRYDQQKKILVESSVPDKAIKDIMTRLSHSHLRPLRRIVFHPLVDSLGVVKVDGAGYDKSNLLYQFFKAQDFEELRKAVTDDEAIAAYENLTGLLADFGFVDECDRAAGVLLLVTAVMCAALPAMPLFLIASNEYGVGKTTMALIAAIFATLEEPAVTSFKKDADEESRELISMLAVRPSAVLIIDNTDNLPINSTLCSIITGTQVRGRVVHSSETVTTVAGTLLLVTGTNVLPEEDMIRRTLSIHLRRPDVVFKNTDIVAHVRSRRSAYVCDALKLIKWGRQKQLKPEIYLGSFDVWTRNCYAPIRTLSGCEPLQRTLQAMNAQIFKKSANQRFLETLLQKFDSNVFTTKKIRMVLTPMPPELLQVAIELHIVTDTELNARKLGWWLRDHVGERVGVPIHELTQDTVASNPAKFFLRKI